MAMQTYNQSVTDYRLVKCSDEFSGKLGYIKRKICVGFVKLLMW